MTNPFVIGPLTSEHRRENFFSGDAVLDHYLRELAVQEIRRQPGHCLVAFDDHGTVAAFYTFAAARLSLSELSDDERGSLPRAGIVPAVRISRLAVDRGSCGQGLGGALIMDAAFRAVQAEPAMFAVLADAETELAVRIYEHLGFMRFKSRPAALFIPIGTVLQAARAPRSSVVPSPRH